jgi:hypothetical protein
MPPKKKDAQSIFYGTHDAIHAIYPVVLAYLLFAVTSHGNYCCRIHVPTQMRLLTCLYCTAPCGIVMQIFNVWHFAIRTNSSSLSRYVCALSSGTKLLGHCCDADQRTFKALGTSSESISSRDGDCVHGCGEVVCVCGGGSGGRIDRYIAVLYCSTAHIRDVNGGGQWMRTNSISLYISTVPTRYIHLTTLARPASFPASQPGAVGVLPPVRRRCCRCCRAGLSRLRYPSTHCLETPGRASCLQGVGPAEQGAWVCRLPGGRAARAAVEELPC